MIQTINYALLVLLFAIGGAAFCIRKSPEAMTAIAAWLMATSEADSARAKYHAERHAAWLKHLGVTDSAKEEHESRRLEQAGEMQSAA